MRTLEQIMQSIRRHILNNMELDPPFCILSNPFLSSIKERGASGTGSGFHEKDIASDLTNNHNAMYNKYSEVSHMARKTKKEEEVLVDEEEEIEEEYEDEDEVDDESEEEEEDEELAEDEEDEESEEESEEEDEEEEDEFQFSEGDVVGLKSGGPAMTIETVWQEPSDQVTCRWFDSASVLQQADFKATALRPR